VKLAYESLKKEYLKGSFRYTTWYISENKYLLQIQLILAGIGESDKSFVLFPKLYILENSLIV